ncbi:hypothetical protein QCD70_05515 [Agreia sp. PsM10]|uniref:hypothetical protein n=1 Tax=Agreia sp. PsM10 TaxID=3030533 RepID=UPI00263B495B|nr:hypothetical protein [Agreia sp. PsM10]MDN4639698.1 hypothetical protein [Agreia sp. PsM10]
MTDAPQAAPAEFEPEEFTDHFLKSEFNQAAAELERNSTTDATAEQVDEDENDATDDNDIEDAEDSADDKGSTAWRERIKFKYRDQIRSVTQERDTAAAAVEGLQRQIIEEQVTREGIKTNAFWAAGADIAGLLAEDGTVNTDAVRQAVTHARSTLGIGRFQGGIAQGAHLPAQTHPDQPTWSEFVEQK